MASGALDRIILSSDDGNIMAVAESFGLEVPFTRPAHSLHRWYGGDYHDTVVRGDDGTWRFTRKMCTPRWQFTAPPFDDTEVAEHRRTF